MDEALSGKEKELVAAVGDEVGERGGRTAMDNKQHNGLQLVRRKKSALDAGRATLHPQTEEGRSDGGRNTLDQTAHGVPQGGEGGLHGFGGGGVVDEGKEEACEQLGAVGVAQVGEGERVVEKGGEGGRGEGEGRALEKRVESVPRGPVIAGEEAVRGQCERARGLIAPCVRRGLVEKEGNDKIERGWVKRRVLAVAQEGAERSCTCGHTPVG